MPGATTLKRKFKLAYVDAADCASPIIPAFAAVIKISRYVTRWG